MDEADYGNAHLERWLAGLIEECQHQAQAPTDTHEGVCRNCGALTPPGTAVCDAECAEDLARLVSAARRGGRPCST